MAYLIYLRKSRADMEAEARGEGETLARHEKTLLDLSKKLSLPIGQIYKEIVSGETIAARPVMQQVILEVEQGLWDGVVVMEVERLARGDTKDQGIVAETFKYSNTKIVTPVKTYDPKNEFDEEYFEFGLFMSRREFKTINRRIQRGRETSVKEGKWIYSAAPYGYKRIKLNNDKGYTLEPDPDEATAVQLIYNLYVGSHIGSYRIANKLTELGYKPRHGDSWSPATVRDILSNIAYAGYVKKGERPEKPYIENGIVKKKRVYNPDCLIVKGLHPALVTLELFHEADKIKKSNTITSNNGNSFALKNPLAGIMFCSMCDRSLLMNEDRKKNRENPILRLSCPTVKCHNISSNFDFVEDAVISALSVWLVSFKLSIEAPDQNNKADTNKAAIFRLEKERKTMDSQISKLHDLLEQGIYDTDTFLQRNTVLSSKIADIEYSILELNKKSISDNEQDRKRAFIPQVENVLQTYHALKTPEEKNILLKSVLEKVSYTKTQKGKGFEKAFTVEIFPLMNSYR